jgi:hypothetical protein
VFVYVDLNGPGPGSGTPQDPFLTIQDAVNYVIPHDYVFVRPGVYNEVVDLPTFVFLRSTDGPGDTVIDATGLPGAAAVNVTTLCEVIGFTIRKADGMGMVVNGGTSAEYGRIIKGNRIIECPQGGISISGPVHPFVAENVIADCGPFGVRLTNGASPFFTGNTITQCGVGLDVTGPGPDAQAFFANSVMWGNGTDVVGLLPMRLIACNVGDPAFAGVNGSIHGDPLWRDPQALDFRLLSGSPCIDAANPSYTPTASEFDNRGYGAWRRLDGDHDGLAVADIGALERGGFASWQTGAGVGSTLHLEVDTGPSTSWALAYGPLGASPAFPFPTGGSAHPYLYLDPFQLVVLAYGAQGASGRLEIALPVNDPLLLGLEIPAQALGVRTTGGTPIYDFTNAEIVRIR